MRPALATLAALAALSGAPATAAGDGALQPCRLRGVEFPAQCGQVKRPLDPAAPDGPSIDVHFAVLPALSRNKRPDPVFFLAGGPGQSAIAVAGPLSRLLGRFTYRRDLVLIDQRGTGRSAALNCPDDDRATRSIADSADPARQQRAMARCRDALGRLPHGDLRRYTTTIAMQDADAVRRALGADRINLVGASYGTRAALEYLRQYPVAVRRVVLDGVAPPDMVLPWASAVDAQAAFDALLGWCGADPDCRRRHPQLDRQWRQLLATLPREVKVSHPYTGRDETLGVTPELLAGLVRSTLYLPLLASALPLAIDEAAQGRWSSLAGLAWATVGNGPAATLAQGMHLSVICAEDAPLLEPGAALPAGDFGPGLITPYRQACAGWPRGTVPPAFYRVGPAPVPVLLLSGAIDPVTPPRHAERVARALGARARHVVVPNAGHGVLGLGCMRDLVFRFIDGDDEDQALAVDAGCVAGLPRPPAYEALATAADR